MGGFYYKSGQKIAANTSGVMPKLYIDLFQPFLDRIPPRPFAEIRGATPPASRRTAARLPHRCRLLQRRLCPSAATLANLPLSPPAAVVEEELGVPLGEVFSEFEEAPLGCASIGQTHRAVLRASGERVVVKACRDTSYTLRLLPHFPDAS